MIHFTTAVIPNNCTDFLNNHGKTDCKSSTTHLTCLGIETLVLIAVVKQGLPGVPLCLARPSRADPGAEANMVIRLEAEKLTMPA